ncbi:hypothetical protein MHLP_04165 [Candidatus Mycoplasma haematolamae str. Purdue]|uniref:Uncharacterized protein n=1 Tax=Mycoplasma haematolamae (strain Purdue) TaxID=1212765 RepID=I7BKJ4_MYCHA|nr:hypothetical protein MHLP_04165 [Candidatus Mycoplasma haematolamae str. Purdue]
MTGVTANVVISSAYQVNGGITLDFEQMDDDVIRGTFDRTNEVKKRQYELYTNWKNGAATWYISNCWKTENLRGSTLENCQKHKANYRNSPEVTKQDVKWEDLVAFLRGLEGKAGISQK